MPMREDYDRLRELLLGHERAWLQRVEGEIQRLDGALGDVPDRIADAVRDRTAPEAKLARALSEAMVDSLDDAVRRRPQAVIAAVYPVIGPSVRRAIAEALQQLADDLDGTLRNALSLRALRWRWEAWRAGVPYAQVVLRHTARYQVEHLFLIAPESGLLLGHVTADGLPDLDADAVAGMFTAINHFVRDSVPVQEQEGSGIGFAHVGDYRLAVSHGPRARLVAFVRGLPGSNFGARLDALNEILHAQQSALDESGLLASHLQQLNEQEDGEVASRGSRWPLWLLLVLCVSLASWQIFESVQWAQRSDAIKAALVASPGLVVTNVDSQGRNQILIHGLLDPDAISPGNALAEAYPEVSFGWQLMPFLSLEPALVQRRVAHALNLPLENVQLPDGQGRVALTGTVPFADWYRLRSAPPPAGALALDTRSLEYPGRAEIEARIQAIETAEVEFRPGSVEPAAGMPARLAALRDELLTLQQLAAEQGIAFRLLAQGFSDESGAYLFNRRLREQRADWLATQLMASLMSPSTIGVDRDSAGVLPYRGDNRTAMVTLSPFPLEQQ